MKKLFALATAIGVTATLGAGVAEAKGQEQVTFEVTITNNSELGQLDTDRAGGQIPLAPALWAVAKGGDNPLFDVGGYASPGLELLAEDGSPAGLHGEAAEVNRISASEPAFGPGGPILAGQSTTFTITASPGDRLFLASMFVQSNDLFFANDDGIRLFHGNRAISGDVTDHVELWDAGTEVNEPLGLGGYQPLAGAGPNVGTDEGGVITLSDVDEDVVHVTITPVG